MLDVITWNSQDTDHGGGLATWVDIADIKNYMHFVSDLCVIVVCQFIKLTLLMLSKGSLLLDFATAHNVSSAIYHIHISINVLETSKKNHFFKMKRDIRMTQSSTSGY